MTKYKYGYFLQILDDSMGIAKYDYLLSDYELLNSVAIYNEFSGIDLCKYDLCKEEDKLDFFGRIEDHKNVGIEKINILFDLALLVNELAEFE